MKSTMNQPFPVQFKDVRALDSEKIVFFVQKWPKNCKKWAIFDQKTAILVENHLNFSILG